MDRHTNEIRSFTPTTNHIPIDSANFTMINSQQVTTEEATAFDHIDTTDAQNLHDCINRLGYGNLSEAVTQFMLCAIVIGTLLLILIGYLFIRQMPFIIRHTPKPYRGRTLTLCGIYTIVGAAALTSLIAYRAYVFCDSVCHFAFLMCAYQYFTLIIDYADGESNFIKNTNGSMVFNMRTPPLCCCLPFLKPTVITKDKFKAIRLMTLQMPIIQGALLALLNVFNAIDTQLYDQMQPFVMIFIVTSIGIGVWSLQITSRMIASHLPEHRIMPKYFAIQLVLILYKLQPTLMHGFCHGVETFMDYRIASKIVENAVVQLIVLLETAFLSYFANYAYSVPTKAFEPN